MKKNLLAVIGVAILLIIGGVGSATAAGLITSHQIQNGTIRVADLRPGAVDRLSAPSVTEVESDGPYPGATVLTEGDNSRSLVTANGQSQTVWVQCAPGKVAFGGGFTLASDAGQAAAEAVTVIESAPTQIVDGAEVYNPIAGDPDGSFLANAWKVVAINDGASDVVVRPHVICATVAN